MYFISEGTTGAHLNGHLMPLLMIRRRIKDGLRNTWRTYLMASLKPTLHAPSKEMMFLVKRCCHQFWLTLV